MASNRGDDRVGGTSHGKDHRADDQWNEAPR
jgi:hypothetical protein